MTTNEERENLEHLVTKAPQDVKRWQELLLDACTADEIDDASIFSLFDKAFSSCPHVDIILDALDFFANRHDNDALTSESMREKFEYSIQKCGGDVLYGASLFNRYREFEVDECEELIESSAPESDIAAAKQRIIKLSHRQLAQPLSGNEAALVSIASTFSDLFVESDAALIRPEALQRSHLAALEQRASRMIYEEHLGSAAYEASTVDAKFNSWMAYIKFELADKKLSRAERLYQRASVCIPDCLDLWLQYVDFLVYSVKNWSAVRTVTDVALKSSPAAHCCASLWRYKLMSLEVCGEESQALAVEWQAAQQCGLASAEEYLEMVMFPCEYWSRKVRLNATGSSDESKIDEISRAIQEAFDFAEMVLSNYYSTWTVGRIQLCKFRFSVESLLATTWSSARSSTAVCTSSDGSERDRTNGKEKDRSQFECWERLVDSYGTTHYFWLEYAEWAVRVNRVDVARSVLRRALNLVKDSVEETCKEWIRIERQNGSIPDIIAAYLKCKPILAQAQAQALAEIAAAQSGGSSSQASDASAAGNKRNKTKREPESRVAGVGYVVESGKKVVWSEEVSVSDSGSVPTKRVKAEVDNCMSENSTDCLEQGLDLVAAAAAPAECQDGVLVKNLPFTVSEEELRELLRGVLRAESSPLEVSLRLTKAGKSKGHLLLAYSDPQSAATAHDQLNGWTVNGRLAVAELCSVRAVKSAATSASEAVSRIQPDSSSGAAGSSEASSHHPTTVYVSKFDDSLSNEGLSSLFSGCGEVVCARVMVDKKSGISKCRGLVQFSDSNGKQRALALHKRVPGHPAISVLPSKYPAVISVDDSAGGGSSEVSVVDGATAAPVTTTTTTTVASSTTGLGPTDAVKKPVAELEQSTPQRKPKLSLNQSSVLSFKPRKFL